MRASFAVRFSALALAGSCLALTLSAPAIAKDAASPDWPCVWRKTLALDAATIWDGPEITDTKSWLNDDAVRKLSAYVIARRLKIEDVEAAIKKFAEGVPEAARDKKLTDLFAGVLSRTNDERKIVINGIERFHKRQLARAKEIEAQGVELPPANLMQVPQPEAEPEPEPVPAPEPGANMGPAGKVEDALAAAPSKDDPEERMKWEVRVFQERQQNIPVACEIPQLMDERAGAVARAIRALMKS